MKTLFHKIWDSPTATTWANLGVQAGNVVLVLPLVLSRFTTEEIAIYYLLLTIANFQLLFTFGFGPSLSRFFAYGKGGMALTTMTRLTGLRGDKLEKFANSGQAEWESIEAVARVSRRLYLWLGLVALVVFGFGGSWAVARPVGMMPSPEVGWMAWAAVLASLSLILRYSFYNNCLIGLGAVALSNRWKALFGLATLILSVGVLLLRGGLVGLIAVRQIMGLAGSARDYYLVRKLEDGRWKSFHWEPQPRDGALLRVIWRSAWRSGAGHFLDFGLNRGLSVFYAQIATSGQLAAYLLAFNLIEVINRFSQAPFYSKLPVLQRLFAAGKNSELLSRARRGMALSYWTYTASLVALIYLGQPILQLIGSNSEMPALPVTIFLGLAFLLQRYGAMHLQLYTLSNHVIWHRATLGYGLIVGVLIYPLYQHFSVTGLALTMLAGYALYYAPYCAWHSLKRFKLGFLSFERLIFLPPVVACLLLVAGRYFF